MTDKKLTDDEIIKALECCKNCCCKQCDEEPDFQEAINLITRQKAEIETFTKNLEAMAVTMRNSAKAERAEARQEFVERLKEKADTYCGVTGYMATVVDVREIDNLLKEMEGD